MGGETYIWDWDSFARVSEVLQHVLDEHGAFSDRSLYSVLAAPRNSV